VAVCHRQWLIATDTMMGRKQRLGIAKIRYLELVLGEERS
jgi:hypothetical protein